MPWNFKGTEGRGEWGKLQTYTDGTYATATQRSRRLRPIRVEKKGGLHPQARSTRTLSREAVPFTRK
jgi:hypothetical protein